MKPGAGMGSMPNMQQLQKQVQKMQQQLMQAQAEVAESSVEGHAAGGLVAAVMSGSYKVQSVTIKPEAVDPDDVETLQDLVVAALRDAHRQVTELTEEKMGPFAQGAGGLGGLPGF